MCSHVHDINIFHFQKAKEVCIRRLERSGRAFHAFHKSFISKKITGRSFKRVIKYKYIEWLSLSTNKFSWLRLRIKTELSLATEKGLYYV